MTVADQFLSSPELKAIGLPFLRPYRLCNGNSTTDEERFCDWFCDLPLQFTQSDKDERLAQAYWNRVVLIKNETLSELEGFVCIEPLEVSARKALSAMVFHSVSEYFKGSVGQQGFFLQVDAPMIRCDETPEGLAFLIMWQGIFIPQEIVE